MKILIVRNSIDYIDVEHNTYNIQEVGLAKALVRRGHCCDIVFFTEGIEKTVYIPVTYDKKITVYYKTGKTFLSNAIYDSLDEQIKKYDILQTEEYSMYESWNLARKYPKKTVVYHGPYYAKFNKKYNLMCMVFDLTLGRLFAQKDIPFIAKSRLAAEFIKKRGIKNVTTIGVGIDLNALGVGNKCEQIPNEIMRIFQNDKLRLLYVGRWDERRNIPFIFEVLHGLVHKGLNVELIMVGSPRCSEYYQSCIEYAEKLEIKDYIHHIKRLEQKYLSQIYEKCNLFLLPTHYEIFGMVLLEAMFFGVPVVTTENGGSDMLIQNEKNGFILPLDVNMWIDKIFEILQKDQQTVIENARKKIQEEYLWDSIAPKFIHVYENIMRGISK